jgi:hypothetical protein
MTLFMAIGIIPSNLNLHNHFIPGRALTNQLLQWRRPRLFSPEYELRTNDQILATLRQIGWSRAHAIAEAEGQQWTFRRTGVWKRKFLIYAGALETKEQIIDEPLAEMPPTWKHNGELTFVNGHSYRWEKSNFWGTNWSWQAADGTTLLTFKGHHTVEFAPEASRCEDLILLILFGKYVLLLMEQEAASHSAVYCH